MIITIDGPSASGKSTIARMMAKELGYYYVCSGMLYRALAYLLVTHHGYTEHTIDGVKAEDIAACFDHSKFVYSYNTYDGEHVFFDQTDITPYLKDSIIDKITSISSVNEYVRHAVTLLQRLLAAEYDIVIDGRDVGSVVFPQADVKFFLTAAMEVRAQRWLVDQKKRGNKFTLQEAVQKVAERDKRDRERAVAPLIIPDDAIVVDNSDLNLMQTFELMMEYVENIPNKKDV